MSKVKSPILNHWVIDLIASHLVTRESEICGRKLDLLKVLILVEKGRYNWIMLLRVASIENKNPGLVMRVLGTS